MCVYFIFTKPTHLTHLAWYIELYRKLSEDSLHDHINPSPNQIVIPCNEIIKSWCNYTDKLISAC